MYRDLMPKKDVLLLATAATLMLWNPGQSRADVPSPACAALQERALNEAITALTELGHPNPASVRDSYVRQLNLGFAGCATLTAEQHACLTAAASVGLGIATCRVNVDRPFPERLRLPALTSVAFAMRPSEPALDDAARAPLYARLIGTHRYADSSGRVRTLEFAADGTLHVVQLRSDGTSEDDRTYRATLRTEHELVLEQVGATNRRVWFWSPLTGTTTYFTDDGNGLPAPIREAAVTLAGPIWVRATGLDGASPVCRVWSSDGVAASNASCALEHPPDSPALLTVTYTPVPANDGTVYPPATARFFVTDRFVFPATENTRYSRQAPPAARRARR